MATKNIILYENEIPEIMEGETLVQEGFKIKIYMRADDSYGSASENKPDVNASRFAFTLYYDIETEANSSITYRCVSSYNAFKLDKSYEIYDYMDYEDQNGEVESNDSTNFRVRRVSESSKTYHDIHGNKTITVNGTLEFTIKGAITGETLLEVEDSSYSFTHTKSYNRGIEFLTADNFTDEETPVFTYSLPSAAPVYYTFKTNASGSTLPRPVTGTANDSITYARVALSFDGETPILPYRDVEAGDSTSFTFDLTEEEREILRIEAQGSSSVPIYYIAEVGRYALYSSTYEKEETITLKTRAERILTIVGCDVSINPIVKDIKPETLALTGDENTFVRYESMAEYAINATASKHATIVSQSVQCGSKTISNLPYGVIDDVESGTFIFNAVDSRNMGASSSVFKNLIEYVKPTCYQKLEVTLTGETTVNIAFAANGSYYNGSFGTVDNELIFQVRYTNSNGVMSEWTTLNTPPTFEGTTYKIDATFSGFDYGKAYTFQSRVIDKLNTVESTQYTIRFLPVFDWSETDFNFNVPVNINAEDLTMNGETIIRHNKAANNTVLSATGGHIYVRPGGTNSTSGETIFYPNGDVKFNGTVTFADGSTGGGAADPTDAFADYVIEIGEEAMGSNGTWYWRKWNSGKAEAWGCRNFGNMAVSTLWGSLYRSAIFTQDLPNNVFIRTPDAININFVHAGGAGWICKHEQTAPSADTTGSFVVMRPVSGNITPTNIGFHIVGEWK